jgi:radical SAM protein with 4Fe4S-binding SPASM domain
MEMEMEMEKVKNAHARTESISPEVLGTDVDYGPVFNDKRWLNYREKWDKNPQNDVSGKVPLQIDLFCVDACNLSCPMCPRGVWDNSKKGYMDKEVIIRILDESCKYGLEAFNFGGLGEPTVHPNAAEIINYAKNKGVTDVNMHTNGTRLNTKRSTEFINSGLDRIIISLDSANKESYEKIRVGAKFEKTYSSVIEFIEIREKLNSKKPHIKVNFIDMDENDDEERNYFINYWKDKANRIGILRYLDFGCYEDSFEELYFKDNYKQDNKYCCSEIWRRLSIWSDGTATICTRDFNKHESIGNIYENTISEIWLGEKMNKFRDLHRNGDFKNIPICATCPDSFY